MSKEKKKVATTATFTNNEVASRALTTVSAEKVILAAIEKGAPIEVIERAFALAKEMKAAMAREAYFADMAKVQSEMPVMDKSKEGGKTNSGVVAYKYAPLGDMAKKANPIITKHGFSYSIRAKTSEVGVEATCVVTHREGHAEEYLVAFPMSTKTNVMSAPQVVAATMTFAKRYAFSNAFGIMTADEDNEDALVARTKNVEAYAFRQSKEKIEASKGAELDTQIAFLEKELATAVALEAGTDKKVPALGLKAAQYEQLLAIARAKKSGVPVKAVEVPRTDSTTTGDEDGSDDAGFQEHLAANPDEV